MEKLTDMPNIGPKVAGQLTEVGISTPEALRSIGGKKAWLAILAIDESVCFHRLCGLEGAVRGIHKAALPADVKEELRAFYKNAKNKIAL